MPSDSLFAAFGAAPNFVLNVFFLFYFLASIYVYISLIRQISARTSEPVEQIRRGAFGLPEAILAAALVFFFCSTSARRFHIRRSQVNARNLLANLLFTCCAGAVHRVLSCVFADLTSAR